MTRYTRILVFVRVFHFAVFVFLRAAVDEADGAVTGVRHDHVTGAIAEKIRRAEERCGVGRTISKF